MNGDVRRRQKKPRTVAGEKASPSDICTHFSNMKPKCISFDPFFSFSGFLHVLKSFIKKKI